MKEKILRFYLRKDIQREILLASKDRELIPKYGEVFGKRPDILQFEDDISELARQGATSFHVSEERWKNPLGLVSGMNKRQLDELRTGFDLVIDIDCQFLEYSRKCAELIVEALRFHKINNIGLKFSGNRSFHIGLPFEAFPKRINDIETRLLFPEIPSVIVSYVKELVKRELSERISSLNTLEEISKATGIGRERLVENGKFNPFSVLIIDTQLISSRHLYRAPYSLNEKSNLVSIPIKIDKLNGFRIDSAKLENVEVSAKFIDSYEENEAIPLVVQALDWQDKGKFTKAPSLKGKNPGMDFAGKINEISFPPCMRLALNGINTDGRKRALFIMMNFLKTSGYSQDEIGNIIHKWNGKNYEPLKEGYVKAQLDWHRRQNSNILPPNCNNKAYYSDIGICKPDELCTRIKNPVQYAIKKSKQGSKKTIYSQ